MPDIVITGFGILASNGLGRDAFWSAIGAGRSGIRAVRGFDADDLPCRIGGELPDFNPEDFMTKKTVRNWHRHVHQGVASAKLAVDDAGLKGAGYAPERMASGIGTSVGSPSESYQRHYEALVSGGYKKLPPYSSSAFSGHAATVHVAIDLGLRGPAMTMSSGCATGLDMLAWGCQQIRLGRVDAAIVGATESPVFLENYAMACSMGILSKRNDEPERAMRPFDRGRDGLVLAEGACVVVLERSDYARARGAQIYGELAGTGSASEARNPLILDRQGLALSKAIELGLADAGIVAKEVDCIQAHGVSLEMYDHCETNAYKRALGGHAYRIPISGIKSMVGQSYSAGGLMGVGAALLTLTRGIVPPTINLDDPDPHCDLDYVPQTSRVNDIRSVLVTAMSFGGTHSVAVLRRAA